MGRILSGFIFAWLLLQVAFAQLEESVDVELVETYVSALDSKGNPVTDLSASDFEIKEDGVAQPITDFSRILDEESQIPLTIGFLLDTSGSMGKGEEIQRIDIARRFAASLMKEMKPADQMRVYAFDNVYRSITPMTSDLGAIQQSLAAVKIDMAASPGTALLASLLLTIDQLEPYFGRKIIVVCSDGQNTIPGPAPETLIDKLKKRDITVVTLTTVTNQEWKKIDDGINAHFEKPQEVKAAEKLMKDLAEETGGGSFFLKNAAGLDEMMEKLRSLFRSQYAIAYKPKSEKKSGWRKTEVLCKRKGVKLQYRKGYYVE